jgi:hypothetical protein
MRLPVVLAAAVALGLATAWPAAAQPTAGQPADWTGAPPLAKAGPDGMPLATPDRAGRRLYIVQLADDPLALYGGDLPGLKATHPAATGARHLDVSSAASRRYLDYLAARQDRALAAMARALGRPLVPEHRYRYAYSGLSLRLAGTEAGTVAALPGVVHVEPAVIEPLATDEGPKLIGAPAVWDGSALGGVPGTKGEGVVAGIVDTGINSHHPSFAAVGGDGYQHTNPRGKYLGWCDPANPNYNADLACNDKLIGLWSFPEASMDPEDEAGHGSHTSSTVAGNILPIQVPTITMDRKISGVAPHANLIMYDACAGNGCNSAATTAAIDQAAADGVDVLNYSIALGRNSPWQNSRMVAFRGAYAAGVFVAASAGNAANAGTVNATAPWITSVAASTHGRSYSNVLGSLTGGQNAPADIVGAGMTSAYGPAPIVYAKGYRKADGSADDGGCQDPFPAGTFKGEIVVCDRGGIGRVEKGENLRVGGAGGFVLANPQANGADIAPDPYTLPAVAVTYADGQALKAWLGRGSGHKATIGGAVAKVDPAQVDLMASFSSRGPAYTSVCCRRPGMDVDLTLFDLLKPDIDGPGVNILAAVAHDDAATTMELGFLSGTSMSGPHLAGAGALMTALHRDWTPAQIQSALMLTARNDLLKNTSGSGPASPFDGGSGRADLARAAATGLVLDIPQADFDAADPDIGGQPATLNRASMANAWCFGPCGWQRTVQSVASRPVTWRAAASPWTGQSRMPAGFTVTVSPAEFTLAPGATQTLTIDADATGAAVGAWLFAQVVLTAADDAAPAAHLPVAVHRVDRRLPPAVIIETDQRLGEFEQPGFQVPPAAALRAVPFGLVAGTAETQALATDPSNDPFDDPASNWVVTREVLAGTARLVAETVASTAPDLDMYVGRDANGNGRPDSNEVACTSGGDSWPELCDVADPPPGSWWIMVQNFRGSGSEPDSVTLSSALVPRTDAGNMTVSVPPVVTSSAPFAATVSWSLPAIRPGDRWFGGFELMDGTTAVGTVVVDILGRAAPPPTPTATVPVATPGPSPSVTPGPTQASPTAVLYLPSAAKPGS